jgi:hypothetical protein
MGLVTFRLGTLIKESVLSFTGTASLGAILELVLKCTNPGSCWLHKRLVGDSHSLEAATRPSSVGCRSALTDAPF